MKLTTLTSREPGASGRTEEKAGVDLLPAGTLNAPVAGLGSPNRLVVRSSGRILFLRADEIDWVEAAGNYVLVHVGAEAHRLRETMSGLESRLDPRAFLRIHRSRLVNIESIREMHPWHHGDYIVVLRDGTRLPMSRGRREMLHAFLRKDK